MVRVWIKNKIYIVIADKWTYTLPLSTSLVIYLCTPQYCISIVQQYQLNSHNRNTIAVDKPKDFRNHAIVIFVRYIILLSRT